MYDITILSSWTTSESPKFSHITSDGSNARVKNRLLVMYFFTKVLHLPETSTPGMRLLSKVTKASLRLSEARISRILRFSFWSLSRDSLFLFWVLWSRSTSILVDLITFMNFTSNRYKLRTFFSLETSTMLRVSSDNETSAPVLNLRLRKDSTISRLISPSLEPLRLCACTEKCLTALVDWLSRLFCRTRKEKKRYFITKITSTDASISSCTPQYLNAFFRLSCE